jgi:hypothetical protein
MRKRMVDNPSRGDKVRSLSEQCAYVRVGELKRAVTPFLRVSRFESYCAHQIPFKGETQFMTKIYAFKRSIAGECVGMQLVCC